MSLWIFILKIIGIDCLFLLSPFDREMTKILENRMDCKKYPNVNDTLADVKERLKNYLPKSTHFEKCVQYVYERQVEQLRKLEMTPSDNLIEVIREEYVQRDKTEIIYYFKDCFLSTSQQEHLESRRLYDRKRSDKGFY